jgi:hypothetical protein
MSALVSPDNVEQIGYGDCRSSAFQSSVATLGMLLDLE